MTEGMTEFEKASELAMKKDNVNFDGSTMNEYVIEWVGHGKDGTATVNFPSSSRFATIVRNLAEKNPDSVEILSDNNVLVAHIPVKAIHLSIVTRELSDEQKQAAAERMRAWREAKANGEAISEEELEEMEEIEAAIEDEI